MAAVLVMAGSVLVVVSVFERITSLRDLETRRAIEQFLSEPPGDGLGLDVQAAISVLQAVSMVAAGCAAAAAILGFHVLRRSRSARLGLTVLAVPLFLSGMVAGGFLSSLVAAAAIMLWLEPARDWFDGRPPRTQERSGTRPSAAVPEPPPLPPPAAPRPHEGFGRPGPGGPPPSPSPYGAPGAQVAPLGPQTPRRRPDTVLWACIVTWVFTGLACLLLGASALVVATNPDLVMEELNRQNPDLAAQGVTQGTVRVATYVTAGVTVVWSAAAAVLALLVFRGVGWARVALVGSAAAAGLVCLVASFGSPLMVVPLVACAVTLSLLMRPDVRAWCTRA